MDEHQCVSIRKKENNNFEPGLNSVNLSNQLYFLFSKLSHSIHLNMLQFYENESVMNCDKQKEYANVTRVLQMLLLFFKLWLVFAALENRDEDTSKESTKTIDKYGLQTYTSKTFS